MEPRATDVRRGSQKHPGILRALHSINGSQHDSERLNGPKMLLIVLGANDVFLYFLAGLPLDSGCLFIIDGISVPSWLCLLFFLWNPQG